LVNCTFATNTVAGGVGGVGGAAGTDFADGGGRGAQGQSRGGAIASSLGAVTLKNTLLADSPSGGNASGPFADGGHNLSSDASPPFTDPSSLNNTNASLGIFGWHGGPTQTVPLLTNSVAVNRGDAQAALQTDQRGYARSGLPDMGAYEVNGVPPAARLGIQRWGGSVLISWPVGNADYRLESTLSLTLRNWTLGSNAVPTGEFRVATNEITGTSQFYRLVK
jgi:hypothetical protein